MALQFTFPPAVWEVSLLFTLSPAFVICSVFHDGHSDLCMNGYLLVILICISLILCDVENSFLYELHELFVSFETDLLLVTSFGSVFSCSINCLLIGLIFLKFY